MLPQALRRITHLPLALGNVGHGLANVANVQAARGHPGIGVDERGQPAPNVFAETGDSLAVDHALERRLITLGLAQELLVHLVCTVLCFGQPQHVAKYFKAFRSNTSKQFMLFFRERSLHHGRAKLLAQLGGHGVRLLFGLEHAEIPARVALFLTGNMDREFPKALQRRIAPGLQLCEAIRAIFDLLEHISIRISLTGIVRNRLLGKCIDSHHGIANVCRVHDHVAHRRQKRTAHARNVRARGGVQAAINGGPIFLIQGHLLVIQFELASQLRIAPHNAAGQVLRGVSSGNQLLKLGDWQAPPGLEHSWVDGSCLHHARGLLLNT
ncbi:hypothetical protein D3C72_861100 [compost metagenome]